MLTEIPYAPMNETLAQKMCPICDAVYETAQTFCSRDGAALRPVADHGELVGQVVADKYRVLRRLGEGGMGQVFLAEHVMINRRSALKVMHPDLRNDTHAIGRFTREATNASAIEHANVAAIYDYGTTRDGLVFLVMEYLSGRPLASVIKDDGMLPLPRVVSLTSQIAAGLKAAHDLGIVHRDLKPENVMVQGPPGGPDVAKLVDFGVSKVRTEEGQKLTSSGMIVGTPLYMSPEQVSGQEPEPASDQFTLAVMAFEMLTGVLPFDAPTQNQQVAARIIKPALSLSAVLPGVPWPDALERVLARALDREPHARFASVTDFAAAMAIAVERAQASLAQARTQVMTGMSAPVAVPAMAVRADAAPASVLDARAGSVPPAPPRGRSTALIAASLVVVASAAAFAWRANGAATSDGESAGRKMPGVVLAGPESARGVVGGREVTRTPRGALAPASGRSDSNARSLKSDSAARHTGQGGGVIPVPTGTGDSSAKVIRPVVPAGDARTKPEPGPTTVAYDASGDLARARQLLIDPDKDDDLHRAVSVSLGVLARTTRRADSTMALRYLGQAHAYLGESEVACTELGRAAQLAVGTELATTLRTIMAKLECR